MSTSMQLPTLCGKCGENSPTDRYTVQEQRRSLSPWTLLTMLFGVRIMNRQTIEYQVPLCTTCNQAVAAQRRRGLIVTVLGMLVFAGGIVWLLMGYNALASVPITASTAATYSSQYQQLIPTSIPIFIGLVIAMIGNMIGTPRFASTNGRTFRFRNKAYQEAFAKLNPTLVK